MMEIWSCRSNLEAKYQEDQEEHMDVEEEENQPEFERHDAAWEAIEKAICNRVELRKSTHALELNLPRETSAPNARYNQTVTFYSRAKKQMHR
jgi:hypothetical protein